MKAKRKAPITKEKYVARVFFSSPFGGLEEERELLTKQYWPELAHLCQKSGYEFVPVDMRWGITTELSSEAATITICLRELDRSDMIVGFFGQRYGWHGSEDKFLQKTFDHAVPRYPWLERYRDRAVTELEFLHGHLHHPGDRPACFFFRDKVYDDAKLAECRAQGDERGQRKFQAVSDGPKAAQYLDNLKERVKSTEDQCLKVVMNYLTPEIGARAMYETVREHLRGLLGQEEGGKASEMDKEHAQHETFLITRLGMGGRLVGGDRYLEEIDGHVLEEEEEEGDDEGEGSAKSKHMLLLGDAGCGKSCVLANWVQNHRERYPDDVLAVHFVGCTSNSTRELDILKHVCFQIEEELREVRPDSALGGSGGQSAEGQQDVRAMRKLLLQLVNEASQLDVRVVVIIDALNKIDSGGRAMKELYWLPNMASTNLRLILSTSNTDATNIKELLEERHFDSVEVRQLTSDLRSKVTKGMLMVRGKELSPKQMEKVIGNRETGNPLYLFILLQELCSFGSFFELDAYIDSLLTSKSTVNLFIKFLERLEKDYNPEGTKLVREVMCCLLLSHRGLSETELRAIAGPTNKEWSALYFAMDDFLLEAEGLYRFAYAELGQAVEALFCPTSETKKKYQQLIIDHFQSTFKMLDQRFDTPVPSRIGDELPWQLEKSGQIQELADCLSALNIFSTLSQGQAKYDLMSYWVATNLSGDDIIDRLLRAVDDQVTLLYLHFEAGGCRDGQGGQKTPAQQLLPLMVKLTDFLDEAGYDASMEPMLYRALRFYNSQYSLDEINTNMAAMDSYCELRTKLACHYASAEEFDRAAEIHKDTLAIRERHVDKIDKGKSYIAVILNNLGFINERKKNFKEAEKYFRRALELHREVQGRNHDLVATSLNNMGMSLYGQGEYREAAKALEESLQIYEEVYFGELPPDIGGTYLNFAMCSARLADKGLEDVEPMYKRALEIRIKAVGLNHPTVAQTYTSYGSYLFRVDQTERGLEMSKDALKISEIASGPEHLNTLVILENIALAYCSMNRQDQAHPYYQRAGEVLHSQGRLDISIPNLNANMVDYYLNQGRETDAQRALARIVTTSFASARDFAALDYVDCSLGGDERPERPFEHSVDYGLQKFPDSEMLLGRKLTHLAPQGKADEMIRVLERGGFGQTSYNNCYSEFVSANQREEGLKIIERAAEKFPDDLVILENLAKCYGVFKQHDNAAQVLAQALDLDQENLDLLTLRVRMLALGNHLSEAKSLIDTALPMAKKREVTEIVGQLENFLVIINEALADTDDN